VRSEWDVPITMNDGLVLRADVFTPDGPGRHPVILSYGPYAKGLAFQDGYADQWRLMVAAHPHVARGSSNRYANWETVDPEKWVPDGYACVRVDSRGAGRSPGFLDPFSPARPGTSTSASSGLLPSRGAPARWASTASPTTR
jgi:putative CocE/NonD family hydrolase